MRVPEAPALQAKIMFQIRIVPADGTRAAKWRKRRLRYVAVFEQLSLKAICLPVSTYLGCRDQSTMAQREINQRWRWSLVVLLSGRKIFSRLAPDLFDEIGDNAAISGITSPINPGALCEA